jgi:hypothetical protein
VVSRRPLTAKARVLPGSIHVIIVLDEVRQGKILLRILRFSTVNIIPSWLSTFINNLETNERHVGGRS